MGRSTDRLDMTIAVDRDVKSQTKHYLLPNYKSDGSIK